jgi:protein-L-isoaspartate(D-aspartate) O-methyltransferase
MHDDYRHQGLRKRLVEALVKKGITSSKVLEAIGKVPRHLFIDDSAFLALAYADQAFPIACGQTISQPYTVAFQSTLLEVRPGQRVLEVGTGSGYQTAVLCELGAKVYSIERQRPLHVATKARLERLGYRATLVYGDGYKGMPSYAPFDKVIVTCGAPEPPGELLRQLKLGGHLVVPVGGDGAQTMLRMERSNEKEWSREEHGAFSFVPMLGDKAK